MVANLRSMDCLKNSPCQHQRECIEKSKGKTNTVRE